jgi:hypothetical protein
MPYEPDRRDYASFREAYPDELIEPNYLPFMVHRFARGTAAGDAAIFCRWSAEQMPIRVYIPPPTISPELEDEFLPVNPEAYVVAAADALEVWEEALEGLVRFERVDSAEEAMLTLRLVGEPAPVPVAGMQRLGFAEQLVDACRAQGWDPDAERMRVAFSLSELVVHLGDDRGPLSPRFVHRLAVHELGHALGMRGHSPSPGDVMYARLLDPPGREQLSLLDVNSFLSLYRLPSGAHLVDVPPEGRPPRPPPAPPTGPPDLAMSPYADARHGFEIQVPRHWMRIEEPHGVFFSDGPSWDYDASLRVFVWPSPGIEDFLECCARPLLSAGQLRGQSDRLVAGRPALQLQVDTAGDELVQAYLFLEIPGPRVMLIAWESPRAYTDAWAPWLEACLGTLEIWDEGASRVPAARLLARRRGGGNAPLTPAGAAP